MKKLLFILLIIIIYLSGCQNQNVSIQKITGKKLYEEQQQKNNILILDVRTKEEFNQGHIPNALNIPVDEISKDTMEHYHKNIKVVVYCRSGTRSKRAALQLRDLGFIDIYDLGSLNNWNYPLVDTTNNSMN